jgi:hypothetical protein
MTDTSAVATAAAACLVSGLLPPLLPLLLPVSSSATIVADAKLLWPKAWATRVALSVTAA